MAGSPFPGGTVEWSGENPGMYLKEDQDGPFTGLASFFRVAVSPHGHGHGVLLLEAPQSASSSDDAFNGVLTDNEPLMRWLVENYATHFGAFRGQPALQALEYRRLESITTSNELPRRYTEELRGSGLQISLTWSALRTPFMVALSPQHAPTGQHELYSLFMDADEAEARVNGRTLQGRSQPRDFAGRPSTTTFLAFSETWVRPD